MNKATTKRECLKVLVGGGWMLLGLPAACGMLHAQSSAAPGTTGSTSANGGVSHAAAGAQGASSQPQGEALDRVVAVVNGDLVLESDVDEERRLAAFQPVRDPTGTFSRDQAIERLIDRKLILQQAKLQGEAAITDDQVNTELTMLRKEIPACKQYHCETDQGWQKFLKDHGFTEVELQRRWRERMEVLAYIELRFRMGIRILPAEINTYYEKTMLPEYAKQHVSPAPTLDSLSDRIQEVLLQQQVSSLLGDWLKSLRAQGSVVIMKPGEMAP